MKEARRRVADLQVASNGRGPLPLLPTCQRWGSRHVNGGNLIPPTRIMDSDISLGDLQSRADLAMHAFLPIHISLHRACIDEKMGIKLSLKLLIVPKLLTEAGGMINPGTYVLPARIYKNARTT